MYVQLAYGYKSYTQKKFACVKIAQTILILNLIEIGCLAIWMETSGV